MSFPKRGQVLKAHFPLYKIIQYEEICATRNACYGSYLVPDSSQVCRPGSKRVGDFTLAFCLFGLCKACIEPFKLLCILSCHFLVQASIECKWCRGIRGWRCRRRWVRSGCNVAVIWRHLCMRYISILSYSEIGNIHTVFLNALEQLCTSFVMKMRQRGSGERKCALRKVKIRNGKNNVVAHSARG